MPFISSCLSALIRAFSIVLNRRGKSGPPYLVPNLRKRVFGGAWVAQSVKRPTSAQIMISRFVSSSPASGSVVTTQNLAPALDSASPSLSDPSPLTLCISLSKLNKHLKN